MGGGGGSVWGLILGILLLVLKKNLNFMIFFLKGIGIFCFIYNSFDIFWYEYLKFGVLKIGVLYLKVIFLKSRLYW